MSQAENTWRPFLDWVAASPKDLSFVARPRFLAVPARHFWDPAFLSLVPNLVLHDDRPGAPEANVFWAGNLGEAGWVINDYESAWMPARLLQSNQ
ncbi:MAG: hypothetical protein ACREEA_04865 [Stellaceae bacterium]